MKYTCCFIIPFLIMVIACRQTDKTKDKTGNTEQVPLFRPDPSWPKPLPNNWLIGQVSGLAVDKREHFWIIHRPGSLGQDEGGPDWQKLKVPYTPAPPVMEFDPEGNLVQAWGGPGEGYEWPLTEHGIFVDHENNVWIGGAGLSDHQVLKFSDDGKFLLQIGRAGKTGGSNSTGFLGRPTEFEEDTAANEIYIADGYLNNRVIVFDSRTGQYKRHWGAYGHVPNDSVQPPFNPSLPPSGQYGDVVHSVRISNDGLVYICDRSNNRIQVFQKDGTFIFERFVAKETLGLGSAWDLDFSPDPQQKFAYVADGTNQCVWILNRNDLKVTGHFGRIGRNAGQFIWIHNLAVDSKGNIYTGEVLTGKRVQKFVREHED